MDDNELKRRFDAMMQRINDNHEVVLVQLRDIRASVDTTQTDMRQVKAEQAALRTYVGARSSETETMITRLFDLLNKRLDQTELSVEERLRKLEGGG